VPLNADQFPQLPAAFDGRWTSPVTTWRNTSDDLTQYQRIVEIIQGF
jgi:hypothetical protein